MFRMRQRTVSVVVGLILAVLSGHGLIVHRAFAETPLPIKIGYQSSSSDDWLLFAARELKLFEKVGLAPEYVPFIAGPPMIAAAKNRSIDVAIVKILPYLGGL